MLIMIIIIILFLRTTNTIKRYHIITICITIIIIIIIICIGQADWADDTPVFFVSRYVIFNRHTGVCEQKHSSEQEYPWAISHEKHQIRGWRGVSDAVLQGRGSRKRICSFTGTCMCKCSICSKSERHRAPTCKAHAPSNRETTSDSEYHHEGEQVSGPPTMWPFR